MFLLFTKQCSVTVMVSVRAYVKLNSFLFNLFCSVFSSVSKLLVDWYRDQQTTAYGSNLFPSLSVQMMFYWNTNMPVHLLISMATFKL